MKTANIFKTIKKAAASFVVSFNENSRYTSQSLYLNRFYNPYVR